MRYQKINVLKKHGKNQLIINFLNYMKYLLLQSTI